MNVVLWNNEKSHTVSYYNVSGAYPDGEDGVRLMFHPIAGRFQESIVFRNHRIHAVIG